MSSLSSERLAELLSRLLTATRSFAYTAHYDPQTRQLTAPAISGEAQAQNLLKLAGTDAGYGVALLAAMPPEDLMKREALFEAALASQQKVVQIRFRCRDAEGKTHWIHEEATVENGNIIGVLSVLPCVEKEEEAPFVLVEAAPAVFQPRPRLLKRAQATASLPTSELEEGLVKEQFTLAYQFQIQPQQRRIVGAEVFIRWRHPEQGLLFPSRFLPQAEESGFIHLLGQWMVQSAHSQQCAWEQAGYEVPLSLNLTGRQVTYPNFARSLPQGKLRFELTEATLLKHEELLLNSLTSLAECGFTLGLDNAGLGELTEAHLRRFPLRYLKIARSLVQNLESEESLQRTKRLLALGCAHEIEIIADGVETPQQAQFLQEAGCHTLQGYLYSRPMGAEALADVFCSGGYHLPAMPLGQTA
jgi:EAL domain-containing protein (putative c-di-GMP-specific phosphodiesterase class I)